VGDRAVRSLKLGCLGSDDAERGSRAAR
jgi:hypothetical protein